MCQRRNDFSADTENDNKIVTRLLVFPLPFSLSFHLRERVVLRRVRLSAPLPPPPLFFFVDTGGSCAIGTSVTRYFALEIPPENPLWKFFSLVQTRAPLSDHRDPIESKPFAREEVIVLTGRREPRNSFFSCSATAT